MCASCYPAYFHPVYVCGVGACMSDRACIRARRSFCLREMPSIRAVSARWSSPIFTILSICFNSTAPPPPLLLLHVFERVCASCSAINFPISFFFSFFFNCAKCIERLSRQVLAEQPDTKLQSRHEEVKMVARHHSKQEAWLEPYGIGGDIDMRPSLCV